MDNQIQSIKASFEKTLAAAATPEALEALRISYLGRKGALVAVFDALKNLPWEERCLLTLYK